MDIESEDQQRQEKGSPNKVTNNYVLKSVQSRMSNESLYSINGGNEQRNQQKISLQSNMSQKVKRQLNQRSLFDQLGYCQSEPFNTRIYGSNPNDYRMMSRISQQNAQSSNYQQKNEMQQENVDQPQKFIIEEKIICRCSKSKCLLMYCECFSKGLVCNAQCECYQCRNNHQFADKRQKARQVVLQKDPNAFTNKLQMVGNDQSQLAYKRGCNCKKTHCFKKYCQCFSSNVKCTYLCHCEGCMNGGQNAYKQ